MFLFKTSTKNNIQEYLSNKRRPRIIFVGLCNFVKKNFRLNGLKSIFIVLLFKRTKLGKLVLDYP